MCIDTGSGTGSGAEAGAIAGVWRDEQERLHVLPPRGRCWEFLRQVDPANLDTTVVLGAGRTSTLRDLLAAHERPEPEPEPPPST